MILNKAIPFLDLIFKNLDNNKVDIRNWEIDHLCYRTSHLNEYKEVKKEFSKLGDCLVESEVNGRLIATYKLKKPIFYKKWIIDLIEIPAPKPHKKINSGFEHIEVVIDERFENFMNFYPHIEFNKGGLGKELNPELEIEFNQCAVKFHHKSLEHIINLEKNESVTHFLNQSQILNKLKDYSPCLSGSLPLGIQGPKSDLDILFSTTKKDQFVKDVEHFFKGENNFHIKEESSHLVIQFSFEELKIELFYQDKLVYKQDANQHFLIEGRLLKILGLNFLNKIIHLKSKGIKTELAFGNLLRLKNPYSELINLNKLSDQELYNSFENFKN